MRRKKTIGLQLRVQGLPTNRCAVYARVSTDKQSRLSPADQERNCRVYAESHTLVVLDDHIYIDEGLSGVGSDRPAFQRMLKAAYSPNKPFDTILVEDTSRLSRSLPEAMTLVENLRFHGLRVIFVFQDIDTHSEQADVQVTVHGLVDSLYVKELAKKTHRGLEGLVLRGLHAGGRCYGYSTVSTGEGTTKRRVIHVGEAVVVKRIFEMSLSGVSLKKIAKTLNQECVPPPILRKGRTRTWCPTAIREMLKREDYKGDCVWNKREYRKVPGTNKRRAHSPSRIGHSARGGVAGSTDSPENPTQIIAKPSGARDWFSGHSPTTIFSVVS